MKKILVLEESFKNRKNLCAKTIYSIYDFYHLFGDIASQEEKDTIHHMMDNNYVPVEVLGPTPKPQLILDNINSKIEQKFNELVDNGFSDEKLKSEIQKLEYEAEKIIEDTDIFEFSKLQNKLKNITAMAKKSLRK